MQGGVVVEAVGIASVTAPDAFGVVALTDLTTPVIALLTMLLTVEVVVYADMSGMVGIAIDTLPFVGVTPLTVLTVLAAAVCALVAFVSADDASDAALLAAVCAASTSALLANCDVSIGGAGLLTCAVAGDAANAAIAMNSKRIIYPPISLDRLAYIRSDDPPWRLSR